MLNQNTEILYLGKKYKLENRINKNNVIEFEDKFYISSTNKHSIKRYLTSWYKIKALAIIQKRAQYYSTHSKLAYKTISINDVISHWGSCSSNKNLHFNWRLIMAPLPVIDYVIIHELVHLEEMNHSHIFWEKVRKLFPLYRQYRNWLKKYGETLSIPNI